MAVDASVGNRAGAPHSASGEPDRLYEVGRPGTQVDGRVNEQPVAFLEQMRQFLRRNMSIFLLAGLVLLLVQDLFGTHGVLAMRRAQKQAAQVKQEIEQIDQENRRLEDKVKSLKSDPQAIERIAREEMGLARPGEYIFKIPSKPTGASLPLSPPADSSTKP